MKANGSHGSVTKEKESVNELEASVFGSVLGRGNSMSREALDVMPFRRVLPGVSPNSYFGVHLRGYADAATNAEMAQAHQPALPQHYQPPLAYQPVKKATAVCTLTSVGACAGYSLTEAKY